MLTILVTISCLITTIGIFRVEKGDILFGPILTSTGAFLLTYLLMNTLY